MAAPSSSQNSGESDEALHYKSIAANVPCMIYRFVLHPDGSFEFPMVSEGCRDIYGVERQQIQENPTLIVDIIVPEDRAGFNESVAESAQTLSMWLWEGRVITGPDEYKWVHGASRPLLQDNGDVIWDGVLMNITSRKEEELKLQASEERFTAFMDNSPTIAFMKDEAGRYVYVNRPFEQRFHLSRDQWFNKTDAELWPETAAALREHDHRVLSSQTTVEIEDTLHAPDGSIEYWRGYKFPVVDAAGHSLIAAMVIDVTEQKRIAAALQEQQEQLQQANAQLELLASKDGLTGLNNHRAFQAKLAEVFNQSARYGTPLSLVILDVDNFKAYNDDFGHPAGDEVLKSVAVCLQHNTRNTDFVARYGGEEFVIILSCTESHNAFPVCERIRRSIEQTVVAHRPVTASFGIASFAPGTTSAEALLAEADRALYHSKQAGRNRITHAMQIHQGLSG